MNQAVVIILVMVVMATITCRDILQNNFLTKKEKNNLLLLNILFPIPGCMIYAFFYRKWNRA